MMNLNINRLNKSKKRACIVAKVDYARALLKILGDKETPLYIMLAYLETALRAYNGQVYRINSARHDPFDVLDVTQMGSDFPIIIGVNRK